MKGYLSIIKYYPDSNRDDGFGIGLILISGENKFSLVKVSRDRLKRINSAYNIKKSQLLDLTLEEIEEKTFDKNILEYLQAYENGNIRYSKPQIIVSEDFSKKFDDLYIKFVADYYEVDSDFLNVSKKTVSKRLGTKFRNLLKSNTFLSQKLNIGYGFKDNSIKQFLIGSPKIDYIGGNGSLYAGEIINLDLEESTLEHSFNKTITLFKIFEKTYPNKFDPSECKFLVLKEHAFNKNNSEHMDILNTWHNKDKYDIIIKDSLEDFQKKITEDVESKKIKRYDEWVKDLS